MLKKVIMKQRRSLSGHTKTEERILLCSSEDDLLKALSGYAFNDSKEPVTADILLSLFDPSRPTQILSLHSRTGINDNITLHTLH
jgi:hypothetical protein